MKKGTKIFVFGGLISLLAGGMIMLITGCIGGLGMFRTIATRYTFYLHNDYHGIFWPWDGHDPGNFADLSGEEEFNVIADDIHSLYVDVDGVELNIENYEGGKDGAGLVVTKGIGLRTEYSAENGTLAIRSKDEWLTSAGEVTIYIPQGMEWDKVELYVGAGTADIEDIRARKLSVNVGAGEASLENARVTETFTASVGMGQLKFDGVTDCDMEISCGMGQIQLELNGKAHYEDYNYDISCAAGNVEIGHMNFAGVGVKRTIDNNSGKHVDVDCGMGEVEISF